MVFEELQQASDDLRKAGELTEGDVQERIHGQSQQLADLASRERGPDHGRLAKHMSVLSEIADGLDGDAAEHVQSAYDHVKEYRSGVPGV